MTPEEELEALRSRVAALEAKELDYVDVAFVFHLPPMLEKIFRLLMAQSRLTSEQLAARLPQSASPKFVIFRLRKALAPFEIEIKSQRHLGYWIDEADKKRIAELARNTPGGSKIVPYNAKEIA